MQGHRWALLSIVLYNEKNQALTFRKKNFLPKIKVCSDYWTIEKVQQKSALVAPIYVRTIVIRGNTGIPIPRYAKLSILRVFQTFRKEKQK